MIDIACASSVCSKAIVLVQYIGDTASLAHCRCHCDPSALRESDLSDDLGRSVGRLGGLGVGVLPFIDPRAPSDGNKAKSTMPCVTYLSE